MQNLLYGIQPMPIIYRSQGNPLNKLVVTNKLIAFNGNVASNSRSIGTGSVAVKSIFIYFSGRGSFVSE